MKKILFAVMTASVAAFAALVPAEASPVGPLPDNVHTVLSLRNGWLTDISAPRCRVKRSLEQDYAGQVYVRKVRICA